MTCKHGFDWRQYGPCPMCEDEHQAREEEAYYNSQSKQESQEAAFWCAVAIGILCALAAIKAFLGGY